MAFNAPNQLAALRHRLLGSVFDTLFVNAGVTNNAEETIADVTTEKFVRVMVSNAVSPIRVIESLQELVHATGLIGIMSSGQGSVANNETGMQEVYRGSKAALNTFMPSLHPAMPCVLCHWLRLAGSAPNWAARMPV